MNGLQVTKETKSFGSIVYKYLIDEKEEIGYSCDLT